MFQGHAVGPWIHRDVRQPLKQPPGLIWVRLLFPGDGTTASHRPLNLTEARMQNQAHDCTRLWFVLGDPPSFLGMRPGADICCGGGGVRLKCRGLSRRSLHYPRRSEQVPDRTQNGISLTCSLAKV